MSTGLIDWSDVGGNKKNNTNDDGIRFLKMKADNSYMIRPLGKPIELWCYWNKKDNRTRKAICGDPDTCPIQSKYDLKPQLRYAINVIDREDGLVKIMEAPPSVFSALKEWADGTKSNPGGNDGGNFQIKITKTVTDKNTITKYSTQFMMQTPVTEEEKKQIEEMGGLYPLEKIYKPQSVEEMEKRLFDIEPSTDETEEKDVFESNDSKADDSTPSVDEKVNVSTDASFDDGDNMPF